MSLPAFVPYPFEAARHEPVLPSCADGVEPTRHAVVVVGGGPVGWCTALGLARLGVRVLLLEADESVCVGSRAICISRRSLEIMDRLGALPGFLQHGLPWTGGRSFYREAEVLRFSMPQDELQRLPPMVNLAQYRIEQILLERAQQLPDLIEVRWQSRVTTLAGTDGGVELGVDTPAGAYRLHADWVVAADGGRSALREMLDLNLEGTSYEGRYVIVDIRMKSSRPTERLAYFDPPCNPGSTVLVHKQPDDVWRIDYQLRDGEDPDAAVLPHNVLPRVQSLLDMMGETAPWAPIWTGLYKANALTLPRYQGGPSDRVLLAGDAAHLLPIFGVRGANSGIDDADNLAWKLALVCRGVADEALLDSYSAERVAAAHENLAHGRKSTEFMAPPSFAFELMRTAVLGLAVQHPAVRPLINPRQTTAIAYRDSPLNALAGRSAAFEAGPPSGTVLPECPLQRPEGGVLHLTQLLAVGFTVLRLGAGGPPQPLRDWAARWSAAGVPCDARGIGGPGSTGVDAIDPQGRAMALLGGYPGTVYLIRPDGHVLARWLSVPMSELLPEADDALRQLLHPAEAA